MKEYWVTHLLCGCSMLLFVSSVGAQGSGRQRFRATIDASAAFTPTTTPQVVIGTLNGTGMGRYFGSVKSRASCDCYDEVYSSVVTGEGRRKIDCPHCDSSKSTERPDLTTRGYRRFRCRSWGRSCNERIGSFFNRLHYPPAVVCLVVLWRVRDKLSFRDRVEIFLDRGVEFTHEAVRQWEGKLAPVLSEALRRYRRGRGGWSWDCDET